MVAIEIYQSNISIVITLILVISLLDLLEGVSYKSVIKEGIHAIIMLIASRGIYAILLKIVWTIMDIVPRQAYNSLTKMNGIGEAWQIRILQNYKKVLFALINPVAIWDKVWGLGLMLIFGIITFICIVKLAKRNNLSIQSRILSGIIIVILPFGMNAVYLF